MSNKKPKDKSVYILSILHEPMELAKGNYEEDFQSIAAFETRADAFMAFRIYCEDNRKRFGIKSDLKTDDLLEQWYDLTKEFFSISKCPINRDKRKV